MTGVIDVENAIAAGPSTAFTTRSKLWDWFASIGQAQPLDGLADDMRELVTR